MKRVLKASFCAVLAVAPWALTAAPALAAGPDCVGTQTGQTFGGGLNVPADQLCILNGGTVTGNATVQSGAALIVNGSTVTGSVSAQGATVQLVHASVGGSFSSVSPVNYPIPNDGSYKRVYVCGSTISGNVSVQYASSFGSIEFGGANCTGNGGGNTIGANLTDVYNTVAGGNHIVGGNQVGNVPYCAGNVPAPAGPANTARIKVGQCA